MDSSGKLDFSHGASNAPITEEQWSRREPLLRMASQLTRLGAWSVEVPSMVLTWSQEVRQIHEVDPDYVPRVETALDFYVPEDRPKIEASYLGCLEQGLPFSVELRLITARNRLVWANCLGEAVRDGSGTIVRVQGAF